MSLRAMIPPGQTGVVVNGLHQWDYGRSLEITHPDLPAEMEVHFASTDSKEAIVHVVSGLNGVATVAIPDCLLEQPLPVTAWVYRVGDTTGRTIFTVTLPIQPRPRPAAAPSVPEEIGDKYTEALGAINEQVESLKAGNVTVARADLAQEAEVARLADRADEATQALQDGNGNNIGSTYQPKDRGGFQPTMYFPTTPESGTVYQFRVTIDSVDCYAVMAYESGKTAQSSLGWIKGIEEKHYVLQMSNGVASVWSLTPGAQMAMERTDLAVYFRRI